MLLCVCLYVDVAARSAGAGALYVSRHDLENDTGVAWSERWRLKMLSYGLPKRASCAVMYDVK